MEWKNSGILWTEPRDITLDKAVDAIVSGSQNLSRGHIVPGNFFLHDTAIGSSVAFADGRIGFIPLGGPRELVEQTLRGDPESYEKLRDLSFVRRIHWPNCAALAALVLSVAVMLFRPRGAADVSGKDSIR